MFLRVALRSRRASIASVFIDPLELFLHSSEPLRRAAAATDDPAALKRTLLMLAIEFDTLRALMPTPACLVALDELGLELRAQAENQSELAGRAQAG